MPSANDVTALSARIDDLSAKLSKRAPVKVAARKARVKRAALQRAAVKKGATV